MQTWKVRHKVEISAEELRKLIEEKLERQGEGRFKVVDIYNRADGQTYSLYGGLEVELRLDWEEAQGG